MMFGYFTCCKSRYVVYVELWIKCSHPGVVITRTGMALY